MRDTMRQFLEHRRERLAVAVQDQWRRVEELQRELSEESERLGQMESDLAEFDADLADLKQATGERP